MKRQRACPGGARNSNQILQSDQGITSIKKQRRESRKQSESTNGILSRSQDADCGESNPQVVEVNGHRTSLAKLKKDSNSLKIKPGQARAESVVVKGRSAHSHHQGFHQKTASHHNFCQFVSVSNSRVAPTLPRVPISTNPSVLSQNAPTWNEQQRSVRDPKVSFPKVSKDFSGVPSTSVSHLLTIWDFTNNFAKTLKLSPFRLRHLEQAVSLSSPCTLIEACILRLVNTIISDTTLVADLGISSDIIEEIHNCGQKLTTDASTVLKHLPNLLQHEACNADSDHPLLLIVNKLKGSGSSPFFTKVDTAGRLVVLRQLVDYASMSDVLRECVTDSLEHIEEEKRKGREKFTLNRKRTERLIQELQQKIIDHRVEHCLSDETFANPNERPADLVSVNIDTTPGTPVTNGTNISKDIDLLSMTTSGNKSPDAVKKDKNEASSMFTTLSRAESRIHAAKERQKREQHLKAIRDLHVLEDRLEKSKADLRALRKSRILRRKQDNESKTNDIKDRTDMLSRLDSDTNSTKSQFEDPVRTCPLGEDRHGRRYWFLPGCGRLWIEDILSNEWSALVTADAVNALLRWLNLTRPNEYVLHLNVKRCLQDILCDISNDLKLDDAEGGGHGSSERRSKKRGSNAHGNVNPAFLNYRNKER